MQAHGGFKLHALSARVGGLGNLNIRALTEDDAKDFRRLRLRALKEHPEAFGSSYQTESALPLQEVAGRLRRASESPDDFTLGAYRQAELVGMVGFFRQRNDKERHKGSIRGMYVPFEEQGKGVGRALLTQAVERARLLAGLEQVGLAVVARNKRARSLYASLGFETYGVEPNALFVDGEYLDEELMVLRLSTDR